jgi:4-hydroxy-tetrahydrodipicolinate synthase
MADYRKNEAREWARATMRGVANVITPTFTHDLRGVNERAIRHDVRTEIEYGFWGALLVAETATTLPEYIQCMEWAADEARGRFRLIHHASFNTLEENIAAVQQAERAGASLVLLSYPANFYPQSNEEIYQYTTAFCAQTNLAVILFPVPLWGFERFHPAGFAPELIKRLVDDVPNLAAIKAEGGYPTIAGFIQTYKMLNDRVVVTFPLESDGLPLASVLPMQFMGTSNYEYYGPMIPRIFALIQEGQFDKAMELYWQIHPARLTNINTMSMIAGSNFIHRMIWKYQGWLNGFNGGPLRQPTMRLVDRQMKALRQGLIASGLDVTTSPDSEFFVGRNPV